MRTGNQVKAILQKKDLYQGQVESIQKENDRYIYRIISKEDSGELTRCLILPGIEVLHEVLSMSDHKTWEKKREKAADVLEINHCRKGRLEYQFQNEKYVYLGEGDLEMHLWQKRQGIFSFPMGVYEGIQILIDIEEAKESLGDILEEITVNLEELQKKLFRERTFFLLQQHEESNAIFEKMYAALAENNMSYLKLKVIELLLLLDTIDLEKEVGKQPLFTLEQIASVKKIQKQLVQNLEQRMPLVQLVEEYGISLAVLKGCFKTVYGKPVYAWRKEYRIQQAAKLLRETKYSVATIASMVGYENASKFTSAFQQQMGNTPLHYRKK